MTQQTKITEITETIAFGDLYISPLNPRTIVTDEETAALADNIRIAGLIHNLAGFREDTAKGVGVVAGGRRYRALALLQDDSRFHNIPVKIAPDLATAQLWASSENAQRIDLKPAEEIRSFGAMKERGMKAAEIAVAYGITEKHVYRRMALAGLQNEILDALQAEEINLSQAAAFTISDDLKLSLEVLEQVKARQEGWNAMTDYQIKQALKPTSVDAEGDRRAKFVGLEAYKKAGGRIGGDLFSDKTTLDDPEILEEVFLAKLADAAEAHRVENGLKWVRVFEDDYLDYDYPKSNGFGRIYPTEEPLSDEDQARFDELEELSYGDELDEAQETEFALLEQKAEGFWTDEQKAISGAVVHVGHSGKVCVLAGLIAADDCAEAIAAEIMAPNMHKQTSVKKSPISEALNRDLHCMQTGARQNALINDPKLALHLLAFQVSNQMGYRTAFGLTKTTVSNVPSTETGFVLDKHLTTAINSADKPTSAEAFAAFRKRGDKKIMEILHNYLVAQLSIDDPDLGEMIDTLTKKNTRDTFTPTAENFFKRVGGPYMVTLWADLLDLKADHPTVTTFAKLKKGEKADKFEKLFSDPDTRAALKLTKAQETRLAEWLPEGMI